MLYTGDVEEKPSGRKRVLIIEDERDYADLLAQILGQSFDVSVCLYGEQGLDEAKRVKPDLIVLDVMMPGIHGLHVLRELRKDEGFFDTPVVILSNMRREQVEADAADLGAEFISKKDAVQGLAPLVKRKLGVF